MAYFTKGVQGAPEIHIWDELLVHTDGLGGGALDTTELDASANDGYIDKGCPLYLDLATKKTHAIKTAKIYSTAGTNLNPQIVKGSLFKATDVIYTSGIKATITSIDKTNPLYDVWTMGTSFAGYNIVDTIIKEFGAVDVNAKTVLTVAGGSNTAPRVAATNTFESGDKLYTGLNNYVTILSVDTSQIAATVPYVKLNLDGAFETITYAAGRTLTEFTTTSKYTANTLLMDSTEIIAGKSVACIYKIDQWIEKRRFTYVLSNEIIDVLNPNIIIK